MYETGTATHVRAFHVMPGLPPPEGERHAHDYRFDVVVRGDGLDERGMVVDLDVLDAALRATAGAVDGADLDELIGGVVGAPAVTVELFARWVHARLAAALAPLPGAVLAVRVWESAVAFGGYAAAVDPAP
ncbi:MAG TPA: 6-carboxytetrahydropterin synthase [Mycobacteriales bacterium]|nr:6-carboxytetrahydropterin synthase [Mycobacteriales bacterium]